MRLHVPPRPLPPLPPARLALLLLGLAGACAPPPLPQDSDGGAADGGATDGGAGDGGATDGGASDDGGTDGGAGDGGADGGGSDGGGSDGGGGDGGTAEPTIRILFPETTEDVTICPTFVMVVDVDGLTLTDFREHPKNVAGEGHWHLYDSGDYVNAYVDAWAVVQLDNDGTETRHALTARLANNDHSELGIEHTVEIVVGPDACIGGDPGGPGDTGIQ